jgi:hypothetical protein
VVTHLTTNLPVEGLTMKIERVSVLCFAYGRMYQSSAELEYML